jgi:hypothetical protein
MSRLRISKRPLRPTVKAMSSNVTEASVALRAAWGVLTPPQNQPLNSFVVYRDELVELRAAVDDVGLLHLLVAGDGVGDASPVTGPLSIAVRRLVFGHLTDTYLDIKCSDPALQAEFRDVAADVVEGCVGAARPGDTALAVIARWRRLLRLAGLGRLQERQRVGLFAELMVLAAMCEGHPYSSAAWWVGPLGAHHDIETAERCVEVKALGVESSVFHVHGAQQLDTHDGRPLDLALATVVPDISGATLTDVIDRVRSIVPDPAVLDARVRQARIDLSDPMITESRYTVTDLRLVAVGPMTPRVVASSFSDGVLPAGVGRIEYEVAVVEALVGGRPVDRRTAAEWWTA